PGVYFGLSAHFSGDGFPGMAFDVQAMPPAQFSRWLATTQASGPKLDESAYRRLLKQSANVSPYTYRAVEPGLFDAIVGGALPPGPGPGEQNARLVVPKEVHRHVG